MERQFGRFHYHRSEPASNSEPGGQAALADGQRYQWLQRRMARRHSQYYLLPRARNALCVANFYANAYCDCYIHAYGYSHSYRATQRYTDSHSYGATESHADGHSYGTTESYTDCHSYGYVHNHAECYGN